MKKLTTMMLAVAALAGGAFAQINADALKLHISTTATVSGAVLGAGDYTIRTADNSGNIVISIESANGTHVLALANRIGISSNPADFNRVAFVRDGDMLRLDKLWIGHEGYEILNSGAR